MQNRILLSCAYLPPLNYFAELVHAEEVYIEKCEHFEKQTYRNRCTIYGANGRLDLVVPLVHCKEKTRIDEKKISYVHPWQNQHWKSICSAYRSAPYFEFFEKDFEEFFRQRHEFLFDFNLALTQRLLKVLRIQKELQFTGVFEKSPAEIKDLRRLSEPKIFNNEINAETYYQVFGNKFGFIPNLSIIDLLFNEGLNTLKVLSAQAGS
jgi:hypothetical protein